MKKICKTKNFSPGVILVSWLNIGVQAIVPLTYAFAPSLASAAGKVRFLKAPAGEAALDTKIYTLSAGETTASVAQKYHMSLEALRKLNQFRTFARGFDHLQPGDELDVPLAPLPVVKWSDEPAAMASLLQDDPQAQKIAGVATQASNFLTNSPNGDAAASMARGMTTGAASTEVQQWLSQFGTARLQLDVDKKFSLKNSQLYLLIPLYEQQDKLLFTQGSLHRTDDGDRIWESQTYTRNVTCKSQLNSGEENLYVYPYPRRGTQKLPEGVKLGLIFDGRDLGLFDADGNAYDSKVMTDHVIAKDETKKINVSFKVYLVKQGEISTQGVTNLTLFQLDGKGSLRDSNYAFSIDGWDNIGRVSCDSSFVSNNAKLSSIDTDKALAGSASEESTVGSVKLNCSSESTTLLSHISHVSGTLKVNGSPFSGNSGYFATDKTGLCVGASYSGTSVAPGGTLDLSVPVSAGAGSKALTFTLNPHLTTSLALGTPDWLFTSQAQDIKSDMTLSFTPQSLQSD